MGIDIKKTVEFHQFLQKVIQLEADIIQQCKDIISLYNIDSYKLCCEYGDDILDTFICLITPDTFTIHGLTYYERDTISDYLLQVSRVNYKNFIRKIQKLPSILRHNINRDYKVLSKDISKIKLVTKYINKILSKKK